MLVSIARALLDWGLSRQARSYPGERPLIDLIATVESNDLISSQSTRTYGLLCLKLKATVEIQAGQFAMLKPHGECEPILRRAMAFYRYQLLEDQTRVEFIYQVLGRGTQALASLRPGEKVDFLGPLGNRFDEAAARDRKVLLVAGGVGSAALFILSQNLKLANVSQRLVIGGSSRGDLCGLEDFVELLGQRQVIGTTIDGSFGEKGLVTRPFLEHLRGCSGTQMMVFACGPDAMLHRVSEICSEYGVPAQLSLESPMACGFGICVGCAVAVKADCEEGFVYKKVCTDGPVFWSEELHWPS